MPPKEPTRQQISSRLSYSQNTPSFLLKLQNRIAGIPDEEEEFDEEFEDDGSGRPPIPRRPAIPERPDDDPGSADEDDGDEKPQVVVLREGKHLTEREAENVRRKERGLPPLPDPAMLASAASQTDLAPSAKESSKPPKTQAGNLSFSSSKGGHKPTGKRKAAGNHDEETDIKKAKNGSAKKKPKKASKTLLSFGDEA